MNFVALLTLVFATWRISHMLVSDTEDGPFGILHTIRYWGGVRYDDMHRKYGIHEIGRLLICIWCTSTWVGIGLVALYYFFPGTIWLMYPFAISGGALLVNRKVNR